EDNEVNQLLAKRMLAKLGCIVEIAENGQVAIDAAKSSHFDLLFMDCQMPKVDGYAATRSIRALPSPVCDLPIVAMTANAMQGDREKCLDAGMDDYISKPVTIQAIRSIVQRVANRELAHKENGVSDSEPAAQRVSEAIDLIGLRELCAQDSDLVVDLLNVLHSALPELQSELNLAFDAAPRSADACVKAAHSLKGALLSANATQAAEVAKHMEINCREGRLEEANAWRRELEQALAELEASLPRYLDLFANSR
ncbi:MAG: response regulator, partial [Planctomycetes bacterium]|nr:response regulator [Planctomycetota bacterium]